MIQLEIQEELNKMAHFYGSELTEESLDSTFKALSDAKKRLNESNRSSLSSEEISKLMTAISSIKAVEDSLSTVLSNKGFMVDRIKKYLSSETPSNIGILAEDISKFSKQLISALGSVDLELIKKLTKNEEKNLSLEKQILSDEIGYFLAVHETQVDQLISIQKIMSEGMLDN